ncbi:SDR family oxidoreductase [Citrobacter freundii]|uniref:SDR family oxidoreductase n=1 Tax=Citrobacter freundii TaxID=546 RepID=UPI0008FD8614|nr:SDR family oxidoreductase [Citrobacter freundii]EKW7211323.1 SDR family oxidoreductase [Citrobacter freundii]ELO0987936.1 SDR family oxidoreductase [Citrobacter freundii]MDE8800902.1 SDR family oxidoreductase [Citrobacter freundii]MDE8806029.1 SDR family oxidoreductase [Citrobacter freundii]OIZ44210.1 SDR family oxidoreductase [Citrobacter freundii]
MTNRKTALITGGNKGIGFEVARNLASKDYSVWLGCRDAARGEQAASELRGMGFDAHVLVIDVNDPLSVVSAAALYGEQKSTLDVLVNNAGIIIDYDQEPSEENVDSIRAVYETNVFGPIRVTQAFVPFLRRAPAARIVMTSSSVGSNSIMSDKNHPFYAIKELGYSTSKAALNAVVIAFSKEFADTPIKVNAGDPGYTATDFNNYSGPRSVEQAATVLVKLATLDADGPNGGFFNEDGVRPW